MRIAINDDPNRVIEFNPFNKIFIIRITQLIRSFERKNAELQKRLKKDKSKEAEQNATNEVCVFMRGQIDYTFGAGTSQKAFGDTTSINMITQFFDGLESNIKVAMKKLRSKPLGDNNPLKKNQRHSPF